MSTAQQLQRALEERAKEIQQLQNKLQRAEAEKQRWDVQRRALESKLPSDVQMLQRQKRELQQQLQREESEKSELFTQINKLIGDLADMQSKAAERPDLSEVNTQLEVQLQRLSAENAQLRGEADSTRDKLRTEADRLAKTHQLEVGRLSQQIRDYQTELNVKTAALESLKLAKPSSREGELEAEVRDLKSKLEQKSQETAALEAQRDELKQLKQRHATETTELRSRLDETAEKLQRADGARQNELAEVFEHVGVPSTSGLNTLKRRISALKTDAAEEVDRRRKLDAELEALRQTLNASNVARQEIARRAQDLSEENEQLRQTASVKEELHTLMLSLRAAKSEVAAKETEVAEWRRRALHHEEERDRALSDLQNTKSALETVERSLVARTAAPDHHELLQRMENELRAAREMADEERRASRTAQTEKKNVETDLQVAADRAAAAEFRIQELEEYERVVEAREEAKRAASDQRRIDDLRRARQEHEVQMENLRAELKAEIENWQDRASTATNDVTRAKAETEEARRSAIQLESTLRRQLTDVEQELKTVKAEQSEIARRADSERRDADVRSTNEINRLRKRESQLTQELHDAQESLIKLRDRIAQLEVNTEIGDSTAKDDRQRLESDVSELSRMNDELRETMTETQKRHDEEMRNMRDEMIENIRRLSDLLEAETKRLQSASLERDRWMGEAQQLEKQIADLQTQLCERPAAVSDLKLKAQVAELTDENAKLAAQLLRPQKSMDEELRRQFDQAQISWRRERATLESEILELRKKAAAQVVNENTSNGNPTPKPRKLNGFGSPPLNGANETSSTDDSTVQNAHGFSSVDSSKMQAELDKHKRLINVLRKKLQHQQIERVQQSRSFCTT